MKSPRHFLLALLILSIGRRLFAEGPALTLEHGERTRAYRLHVPEKPKNPTPLVFVSIGGESMGAEDVRLDGAEVICDFFRKHPRH